ncbi:MAG: DUF502 domain-containing protein [Polyangiaceae bacterium]|nr:DUF502 domain-containing protein [Polyangiaceae bacterium]
MNKPMRSLIGYFVRGMLVVVPTAFTVWVVYFAFTTVDKLLPLGVPGLGLVVTLAVITFVGFLSSNVIGNTLVEEFERLIAKLPLTKLVYSSIKDLMGAFVGDRKRFDRPVSVSLTSEGAVRALGFITREELGFLGMHRHVAVYFPQSYNFAGNLVLVPSERIEPLSTNSAELMTFIVSGGVSGYMEAEPGAGPGQGGKTQPGLRGPGGQGA